ncbi:hypothetical protein Gorai_024809, partial [Gossypium raimondii]|nr:hypothetical protein [Gossypium raimondii]
MTMQFWAASACSCGVLIFLFIVTWCAANNKNPHFSCSVWDAKFSLSCVILYSAVCCISLATISHTGEANLVTSGLVLYFGDMLACTISKVCRLLIPPELVSIRYGIKRSEIGIVI